MTEKEKDLRGEHSGRAVSRIAASLLFLAGVLLGIGLSSGMPYARIAYWRYRLARGDGYAAVNLWRAGRLPHSVFESGNAVVRQAVVFAWSTERDLITLYNLAFATSDPDARVRQAACLGLQLRATDCEQLGKTIGDTLSCDSLDSLTASRLSKILESTSYHTYKLEDGTQSDLQSQARAWRKRTDRMFDALHADDIEIGGFGVRTRPLPERGRPPESKPAADEK